MKIAIDGMGGDNAPQAVVERCCSSFKEYEDIKLYITGPKDEIEKELSKYTYPKDRVTVVHTSEVISPNEHPVMAIRKKRIQAL